LNIYFKNGPNVRHLPVLATSLRLFDIRGFGLLLMKFSCTVFRSISTAYTQPVMGSFITACSVLSIFQAKLPFGDEAISFGVFLA